MSSRSTWPSASGSALLVLALATGCDRASPAATPELTSDRPAPIEAEIRVRVESASSLPLGDAGELTGIVEPHASVVVAAETAARVTARLIERGDQVKTDQLLFELDGSRAWIEYERAQASVGARQSDLAQAERERSRSVGRGARAAEQACGRPRAA